MSPILLAADLVAILVLVFGLFVPRHHRRDLVVALLVVNVGVLAVMATLSASSVGVGVGLGLFGVLSIIRLRSEELNQHEVAYYFAALALGLVAGSTGLSTLLVGGLMALVLVTLYFGDHPRVTRGSTRQQLLLDRAFNDDAVLRTHVEAIVGPGHPVTHRGQDRPGQRHHDGRRPLQPYGQASGGRAGRRCETRVGPGGSGSAMTSPATMGALEELPAISLERLLSIAALQTRIDRKYVLAADELPGVIGAIDGRVEVLSIDGRRHFAYRSTYFDTPDLEAFHRSGRGRRRRFKVRTRVYRHSGETWLEVKTRGPRGTTVKDRRRYDLADAGRLTADARAFVADTLAAHLVEDVDVAELVPSLHTAYDRATLLLTGMTEASRATIDSRLAWRRPGSALTVSVPGRLIVETKGGSSPSALDRALWRAGTRPSRVSKYGAGLAVLDDGLPDLKWHRVLTQLPTAQRPA